MSRRLEVVEADASVWTAAEKMRALDLGALPVVAHGRLVGMLTDRDVAVRVTAHRRSPDATRVREIMTPGVMSCFADQDVEHAAAEMARQSVRRLVVLDRELQTVGMLSVDDLAMYAEEPKLVCLVLARAGIRRAAELDGILE